MYVTYSLLLFDVVTGIIIWRFRVTQDRNFLLILHLICIFINGKGLDDMLKLAPIYGIIFLIVSTEK